MDNFCEHCGERLSEGVRFCEACGQPLASKLTESPTSASFSEPTHNFCEQCGTRLPKEARFCEGCGQRVEPPSQKSYEGIASIRPPYLSPRSAKLLTLGAVSVVLIAAVSICLFWWKGYLRFAKGPPLNSAMICETFAQWRNKDGNMIAPKDIKFEKCSFTQPRAQEAIVSFFDNNSSHAAGWSQVWLIAYDGKWSIKKNLFRSDSVSFKIVDLGDGGCPKVWVQGSGGGQGEFTMRGQLFSLAGGHAKTLFETKGHDNTGGSFGDLDFDRFEVLFRDVNNERLKELVEIRTKGRADPKTRKEIVVSKIENVYHLIDQRYVKINADSGRSHSHKSPGDVFVLTAIINDPDGYTNVRREKSAASDIVTKVKEGEKFYTYKQSGDWWQIKTRDGKVGYMHVSRIKIVNDKAAP